MQVLVDTSIWIDHFRRKNSELISLLEQDLVLTHPAIIGEMACGRIKDRLEIINYLKLLSRAKEATDDEVLEMIELNQLFGSGLNWIDVHLLASALISKARLWTYDKPLAKSAQMLMRGKVI